jgi:hypothetical protein
MAVQKFGWLCGGMFPAEAIQGFLPHLYFLTGTKSKKSPIRYQSSIFLAWSLSLCVALQLLAESLKTSISVPELATKPYLHFIADGIANLRR